MQIAQITAGVQAPHPGPSAGPLQNRLPPPSPLLQHIIYSPIQERGSTNFEAMTVNTHPLTGPMHVLLASCRERPRSHKALPSGRHLYTLGQAASPIKGTRKALGELLTTAGQRWQAQPVRLSSLRCAQARLSRGLPSVQLLMAFLLTSMILTTLPPAVHALEERNPYTNSLRSFLVWLFIISPVGAM